jgi:tRNA(Ile)-lysidine synthase
MTLDPAVAAVRRGVRLSLIDGGGLVLVACSGGADSLALLSAAVFETRRRAGRVVGVTVDHGLQEGSREHADAVVKQMAALGADETMAIRVTVNAPGVGVEAAARQARYAALGQAAVSLGCGLVLLGHTLDDQAETVLMGLTRGSGGRSIAGMRRAFYDDGDEQHLTRYERPLLDVTRAQTEAACRAEGIDFWTDPHNADPRFLRSRVRHTVLPVLEAELGPGVAATLARTAGQLRQDMEALDIFAERTFHDVRSGGGIALRLDIGALEEKPWAVIGRVLRLAALEAGSPASELFAVHVEAMVNIVFGDLGRQAQLPGHVTVVNEEGRHVAFRRTASTASPADP